MACLKSLVLPALSLLHNIFKEDVIVARIFEDNNACSIITKKGTSAALARMPRTHRVSVSWISEVLKHNDVDVVECSTNDMIGDIMTKSYPKSKWPAMLQLVRVGPQVPQLQLSCTLLTLPLTDYSSAAPLTTRRCLSSSFHYFSVAAAPSEEGGAKQLRAK